MSVMRKVTTTPSGSSTSDRCEVASAALLGRARPAAPGPSRAGSRNTMARSIRTTQSLGSPPSTTRLAVGRQGVRRSTRRYRATMYRASGPLAPGGRRAADRTVDPLLEVGAQEPRVEQQLLGRQMELVEPVGRRARVLRGPQVGQRRPVPSTEGGFESVGGDDRWPAAIASRAASMSASKAAASSSPASMRSRQSPSCSERRPAPSSSRRCRRGSGPPLRRGRCDRRRRHPPTARSRRSGWRQGSAR